MTKKLIKNILISGALGVAIVGIGLYANVIKLPIEKEIHVQYAADFNDDKVLVGAAHNVFIGKVVKQIGEKKIGGVPETQFSVDVVSNIKGNLQGVVTVNQQGGYLNGVLYLVDGGDVARPDNEQLDKLLQVGSTYLFATRYNESENWHTLIAHPNAKKLLSDTSELSDDQVSALIGQDGKVAALREAYKNEIPFESDVMMNNQRNSYQAMQGKR